MRRIWATLPLAFLASTIILGPIPSAKGSRTFGSWDPPAPTPFDKSGVHAPLLTQTLAGSGGYSGSNTTGVHTRLPYGLTNESVIALTRGTIGFSGITMITGPAVP